MTNTIDTTNGAAPARRDPHYHVLRRTNGNTGEWLLLTPAALAAPSRQEAIRLAAAELPAEERGGLFAVILDSQWETITRTVVQRTVDEDSFESAASVAKQLVTEAHEIVGAAGAAGAGKEVI